MISKFDVRQAYKRALEKGTELDYYIENDSLYAKEDNSYVCSFDDYVDYLREKHHCDFECIYYDHIALVAIYRCRECGTVIFGGEDQYTYDPNLRCPTCGEYKTHLVYWTKEDIEQDEQKQKQIRLYEEWQIEENKRAARRQRRGGLYDWQMWKKVWYGKKYALHIEFHDWGHGWDGEKPRPWKYREIGFEIRVSKREDDISYIEKYCFHIPLSPYAIRLRVKLFFKNRKRKREKNDY